MSIGDARNPATFSTPSASAAACECACAGRRAGACGGMARLTLVNSPGSALDTAASRA